MCAGGLQGTGSPDRTVRVECHNNSGVLTPLIRFRSSESIPTLLKRLSSEPASAPSPRAVMSNGASGRFFLLCAGAPTFCISHDMTSVTVLFDGKLSINYTYES